MENPYLFDLSLGPLRMAKSWPIYYLNGYKFQTSARGEGKKTYNCGVSVTGIRQNETSSNYYGVLKEILELEWPRLPIKKSVLFYCDWFDTSTRGMRVHKQYDIVEVNKNRKYATFDPFIFPETATQVYYAPYPGRQKDKADWLVVLSTKPRGAIDRSYDLENAYQIDQPHVTTIIEDDPIGQLHDDEAPRQEISGIEVEENEFIHDDADDDDNEHEEEEDEEEEEEEEEENGDANEYEDEEEDDEDDDKEEN